jgi:hypothetical protein
MEAIEWKKVDFQDFINKVGASPIIENAPIILYTRKDKEHAAFNTLIAFFIVAAILCVYISISLWLIEYYFNIIIFSIITSVLGFTDVFLMFNYVKSNIYIKPMECWIEIYKKSEFYCFSYYPIFSGKCHPNKAKDIIYKLFQVAVLKNKIDITQIEVYLKCSDDKLEDCKKIGFYFQYGKGKAFKDEEINRDSWAFFPFEKSLNENFIAVANWIHQYEWRLDLENDNDKLNNLTPWVIKRWDQNLLKPLTDDFKVKINWNLFNIESLPKMKPWEGDLEKQTYKNPNAYNDLNIVDDAIKKIMGKNVEIKKLSDLENQILKFKIYFRDLKL